MTTDIWQYLEKSNKPITLYGTGNGADKIMDILEKRNITVSAVFASDGFVRERIFRGYKVIPYSACKEQFGDMIVLMCFGSSRPEVLENVRKIAAECEFYAPDVPVYGDTLFDKAFYEEHKAEFDEVRKHLADEASVNCFDNHIKYKLTGDIKYLSLCETQRERINEEFFRLDGGSLIDLGAYNGDTALEFAKRSDYEKIIAVEPDKRNFRKLSENTSALENIFLINAAASSKDGEKFFDTHKGRGAHLSDDGDKITCRCVDSIVDEYSLYNEKIYIKYDVEGNELEAINGAQRTIRKYAPFMNIACYHRSEDLFSLPLRVLKLNGNYKIYMRHSPHIPAWDTEYYFIPEEDK